MKRKCCRNQRVQVTCTSHSLLKVMECDRLVGACSETVCWSSKAWISSGFIVILLSNYCFRKKELLWVDGFSPEMLVFWDKFWLLEGAGKTSTYQSGSWWKSADKCAVGICGECDKPESKSEQSGGRYNQYMRLIHEKWMMCPFKATLCIDMMLEDLEDQFTEVHTRLLDLRNMIVWLDFSPSSANSKHASKVRNVEKKKWLTNEKKEEKQIKKQQQQKREESEEKGKRSAAWKKRKKKQQHKNWRKKKQEEARERKENDVSSKEEKVGTMKPWKWGEAPRGSRVRKEVWRKALMLFVVMKTWWNIVGVCKCSQSMCESFENKLRNVWILVTKKKRE